MGKPAQARRLSDAARGRAPGRLSARLPLRLRRDEGGATAIEYCLILSLIAVVLVGALNAFSGGTSGKYDYIREKVTGAIGGQQP